VEEENERKGRRSPESADSSTYHIVHHLDFFLALRGLVPGAGWCSGKVAGGSDRPTRGTKEGSTQRARGAIGAQQAQQWAHTPESSCVCKEEEDTGGEQCNISIIP